MKCNVSVTPITGKPKSIEVDLAGDATSVNNVLEAAGLKAGTAFHIFVNGKPANLIAQVPDGANVSLTEKAAGS